jgi:hypothetical protein
MKTFYYHNGQEQKGPVSLDELKALPVNKDTMIWREGMQEWRKAGEVEDLKEFFSSIPPPLITSPPKIQQQTQVIPPRAIEQSSPSNSGRLKIGLGLLIAVIGMIGIYGYWQNTKREIVTEAVKEQQNIAALQKMEIDDKKREEERQVREAIELKKESIRNQILKYVQKGVTYNIEAFGGLNNVLVTVVNNTEYPIEEVIVRVSYIKGNGGLWTTYDVLVRNIAAKGSASARADDSNRGTKIETEILSIKSKALDLCFDNMVQGGKDPYRCR